MMALYLKLDVWDGRTMKTLGHVEVRRDRDDDPKDATGNYHVEFSDDSGKVQEIGTINQYDRTQGAWELAHRALSLCRERYGPA